MLQTYFAVNFFTIIILTGLVAMMYVNRNVTIPATNYFIVCILVMIGLTIVGTMDIAVDVSNLSPIEVSRIVSTRRIAATLGYFLRPCIILSELLIILEEKKYRILCMIPAIINALIYSSALFGSDIAFGIDEMNTWYSGPLHVTIYATMLIYLLMLLHSSFYSFHIGKKNKSLILFVIFFQAVLVGIHEFNGANPVSYSNDILALGMLEYYIYLSNVYRQELTKKLDAYVSEVEEAGNKLKALTAEVIEALTSAIDAKDKYTHGHASRVADYSRKLAEMNHKSQQECDEIYYAALLHDVGKIGISDNIITKEGKLTKEEYEQIKKHTILGTQILQRIKEFPYLSTGAVSHHERYDGMGYPSGIKGDNIPEAARIISVADAYDAMSSKRSYRDPIPQNFVRAELERGMGTQFDPVYAQLMIRLIDEDTDYEMSYRGEKIETASCENSNSA